MQQHGHEQNGAHDPEQRPEIAQMLRVTVDPVRPEKDLQIAEQMADDEEHQNDSRDRDDQLFADGSAIKSGKSGHDVRPAAPGVTERFETIGRDSAVKTWRSPHSITDFG